MSIKPVDFQLTVQKAGEHSREANQRNQAVVNQQQDLASEFQKKTEHQQIQVVPSDKASGGRVDKDGGRRNKGLGMGKKNKKYNSAQRACEEKEKPIGDNKKGLNIDITI